MESTGNPGATTWHYGLIARWWALFRRDGPEVAFFRRYVEAGQPALDLACGTGRLLVPYVGDGLDVDGADVSADMLAYCRDTARGIGAELALYEQANHELDIPKSYRTIFAAAGSVSAAPRTTTRSACAERTSTSNPAGPWCSTTRSMRPAARWQR